jgi:hypothetical protein
VVVMTWGSYSVGTDDPGDKMLSVTTLIISGQRKGRPELIGKRLLLQQSVSDANADAFHMIARKF